MAPAENIPEAWPLLLTRQQARAYLGGIAEGTFLKVCPVPPVDLGANVVRYRRPELDTWIGALTHRLPGARSSSQVDASRTADNGVEPPQVSRPSAAVQRALERAQRGAGCKRSAMSNG